MALGDKVAAEQKALTTTHAGPNRAWCKMLPPTPPRNGVLNFTTRRPSDKVAQHRIHILTVSPADMMVVEQPTELVEDSFTSSLHLVP
ncbi:hypothetical protein ZHAS_00016313 [Anopheles sinensis]|uniref:Uncharacterized protein n=1 Tax=Anopheles sinensis TaxID=74873 RepID=A0A084WDN6_ANOSI|nr:hypothetical protein ZHAS_00016313 [Anopheles sinensis]